MYIISKTSIDQLFLQEYRYKDLINKKTVKGKIKPWLLDVTINPQDFDYSNSKNKSFFKFYFYNNSLFSLYTRINT